MLVLMFSFSVLIFFSATAYMQSAHMLSPVRPSVRVSVTRVHQSKTVKLGSCNFHHRVYRPIPPFLWYKFNPEILTGSPERGRQTRVGWGKQAIF